MRTAASVGTVRSMAPLLVIGAAVMVLGAALFFMSEALEERESAAAAAELRAASLTLASVDALVGTPLQFTAVNIEESIAVLEGDHAQALHSLSPVEQQQAEELLVGVTMLGHSHIHTAEEHSELLTLLGKAAEQANTDATQAAEHAATAIAAALLALTGAAWTMANSRTRVEKEALASASESALRHRLETLLNDLPDMLFVFDGDGAITYRSTSVDELLPADATTADLVARVSEQCKERLRTHLTEQPTTTEVFEVRTETGSVFLDIRVTDLADDEYVDGHLVTARDVTAELVLRSELEAQASVDLLTGLLNRRALDPALEDAQRHAEAGPVGFLLVDFDDFKEVNDTLGHLVGDQLLREAASRMQAVLRSGEVLLRLGGDEFALVLAPIESSSAVAEAGARVRAALRPAFDLGETEERLRTSVGAVILDGPFEPDELLGKADIALYEAKADGGNRLVMFEPEMEERSTRSNNIMRALRTVDFDDEFSLVFQPIFDVETNEIVSLEALLRWHSPSLGTVSPGDFIPIAERIGLMPQLGDWVLNAVCQQTAQWDRQGLDQAITVSFNVSAQQLEEAQFVASVFNAIERWGISSNRLVAEVTESMVIDRNSGVIDRLSRLRRGGVKISVDDFGSGYSNLGQLLGVPLDLIKIDRDLLVRLGDMREASGGDPAGPCAIMQAIVSIADMLNAPVVCEGVETDVQRMSLRSSGVSYLQGYLLARPAPPEELVLNLRPEAVLEDAASVLQDVLSG